MNPFEFVIAIIVLCFVFSIISTWLRQRGKEGHSKAAESTSNDLLGRLARAEERIRVLERIVTDERWDLKKEFQDLER
jgi:phage shock protein B